MRLGCLFPSTSSSARISWDHLVRMLRQCRLQSVGQRSSSPPPPALPRVAIRVPNARAYPALRSMSRMSVVTPHYASCPTYPCFRRIAIHLPIPTVQASAEMLLYAMRTAREWCRLDRMMAKAAAMTRTRKANSNKDAARSFARSRLTHEASSPQRSLRAASLRARVAKERRRVNRRSEFVFRVLPLEGNTPRNRCADCKGRAIC